MFFMYIRGENHLHKIPAKIMLLLMYISLRVVSEMQFVKNGSWIVGSMF